MDGQNYRPGMPPYGHYAHFGRCFDDCESYAELRLLQEFVAWPRSGFVSNDGYGIARNKTGIVLHQQHSIASYRADFALTSTATVARLVVEVDGKEFHGTQYDAERDTDLVANGWAVLRIPAADIVCGGGARRSVDLALAKFAALQGAAKSREQDKIDCHKELVRSVANMTAKQLIATAREYGLTWTNVDPFRLVSPVSSWRAETFDIALAIDNRIPDVYQDIYEAFAVMREEAAQYRIECDRQTEVLLAALDALG